MITLDTLRTICPLSRRERLSGYVDLLNEVMPKYRINTPERVAAFLAQLAHESGGFRYTQELASGADYEGRSDLGNTQPGDGVRFKGRGLIQLTGRANYERCGQGIGLDLINHPELLEQPPHATESAAWFWESHGLNDLADRGDQRAICRRINGGYNGLAERLAFYERAINACRPQRTAAMENRTLVGGAPVTQDHPGD